MKHRIWRTALTVISGFALVATAVGAEEHELERMLELQEMPREMREEVQEEWDEPGPQGEEPDRQGNHQGEHERDRHRNRDDRPNLLRVPGLSAEERARDGLDTRERQPVPWVDDGPETDVESQIETLDQLMPTEPGLVGRVLDGHDYCGLGCGGAIRTFHRGGNPVLYYVTCRRTRSRCTDNCGECGCAVYNSPKGGTERSHYREGTRNGRVQLESATEANTHDWYCYCVED